MLDFSAKSLKEIYPILKQSVSTLNGGDRLYFTVANPDADDSLYAGELIKNQIYRSFRSWSDLANLLNCRLIVSSLNCDDNKIVLVFEKLRDNSFHQDSSDDITEKYGVNSQFFRINKSEEPSFYIYYIEALKHIYIEQRYNILGLGINRGDEFEMIADILPSDRLKEISFVGVEYSKSALSEAKKRLKHLNFEALEADISNLVDMDIGRFDMLVSIGTLQSPKINMKTTVMYIVQELLQKRSAIVLGFPNCRWIDGEMIYGARVPNYSFSELSAVIKDIHWIKKYLQQHKFRVMITGREYLFLSAVR